MSSLCAPRPGLAGARACLSATDANVYVSDATSMRALMSDSEQKGRPQGSQIAFLPADLSKSHDLNRFVLVAVLNPADSYWGNLHTADLEDNPDKT